jgi:hypothetical protein
MTGPCCPVVGVVILGPPSRRRVHGRLVAWRGSFRLPFGQNFTITGTLAAYKKAIYCLEIKILDCCQEDGLNHVTPPGGWARGGDAQADPRAGRGLRRSVRCRR